jgi:methylphosphotriester-DNA--protein-cysteine methyltransferase
MNSNSKSSVNDLSRPTFDNLCAWIDAHLDECIGWQQLLENSQLDFQTIQLLFFKHASTTPMTWIRKQRAQKNGATAIDRPTLTLRSRS